MQKRHKPTNRELLGHGIGISGNDFTGNDEFSPQNVPPRTKLPGRGDPSNSLDQFSPECDDFSYDFGQTSDIDYDSMDDVCPEDEDNPDIFVNSQTALDQDCP